MISKCVSIGNFGIRYAGKHKCSHNVCTSVLINDNMAKEKFIKYHIWNSLRPYGEASHDNVMKYFKSTGTYYYEFLNKGLTAKQSYKLSLRK